MAQTAVPLVPALSPDRPALRRCVAVEPSTFASAHWGAAPLLSRASELTKGFDDLLTLADADDLVSRRGLRTPFLRIAKDGAVVDPRRYTGPGGAGAEVSDQVLDERVLELFADGATLVLQGLHRIWPPLVTFAGQLGADLGHPVQINAYLTPPANQGFAVHYDTHDVFVLQVAGAKRWRVHPPVLDDPLPAQSWGGRAEEVAATATGSAAIDTDLEPGDVLYLPRGWLHAARAHGEVSLHLTVGVHPVTRYALVQALLELATDDRELRRSLPLGLDLADPSAVAAELRPTLDALSGWLGAADPDEVAGPLRRRWWPAGRPAPIRPLAQATALGEVGPTTRLAPRGHLRWLLRPDGADRVALELFDRTISFPASCADAVRALLSGTASRVGELPGLSTEEQRVLARRLLLEAVVVPLEA